MNPVGKTFTTLQGKNPTAPVQIVLAMCGMPPGDEIRDGEQAPIDRPACLFRLKLLTTKLLVFSTLAGG